MEDPDWSYMPDPVMLYVFSHLNAKDLMNVRKSCKTWLRLGSDEFLWQHLFHVDFKIDRSIPIAPGKNSWLSEYKRLKYHTPTQETEILVDHTHQVLHVSFAHNGEMFASSSKDGYIKVWKATYPAEVCHSTDMKSFSWNYTQFSQFNESDTLLLVSGVHFGAHTASGEIAVFNLQGNFTLQCRVLNKPYDIFGTWYTDDYLLSGRLHFLGHLVSCSALWLNKAWQESESEKKPIIKRLFKFYNRNASSIRTITVANCYTSESKMENSSEPQASRSIVKPVVHGNPVSRDAVVVNPWPSRKSRQTLELASGSLPQDIKVDFTAESKEACTMDSLIRYSQEYRKAERAKVSATYSSEEDENTSSEDENTSSEDENTSSEDENTSSDDENTSSDEENTSSDFEDPSLPWDEEWSGNYTEFGRRNTIVFNTETLGKTGVYSMDSKMNNKRPSPERLKILCSGVMFSAGNNLLHQFVLDNSNPNDSGSKGYINAVLLSLAATSLDVNALNADGYSPLHLAVLKNNLLMVKKLLHCPLNINVNTRSYWDKGRCTALHLSAKLNYSSIVQELLNKGADVNAGDKYNETTLHYAVKSGNIHVVKLLISSGADINASDRFGETTFLYAIKSKNVDVVKLLVSSGADINVADKFGIPAFLCAIHSGNVDVVKILVSSDADVNVTDRDGKTAFHCAIECGNVDVVKFLVHSRAHVNARDRNGKTALHYATEFRNVDVVKLLVWRGADLNARDRDGKTALHYAIEFRNVDVVKFLVHSCAHVNAKDKFGKTILHYAIKSRNVDFVKFLVSRGADINSSDIFGETTFLCAAKYGNVDVVKFLVSCGADVNATNRHGKPPLNCAIECRNLDVVKFLVHSGADVDATDKYGDSSLHCAMKCKDVVVVEFLVSSGANVNDTDRYGKPSLHCAIESRYIEIIKSLVSSGADVNATDRYGKTALNCAIMSRNLRAIKFLVRSGATD